jgi:RNA polymerase sigma-70 factor (ECF subfamily)
MSDGDLIRDTLRGDERAFEELVRRHKDQVMRQVWRFAPDPHEADSLAQDVFVRAYFSLSRYRGEAPFANWLARIATRVSLDHLRKRYRRRETLFSELRVESVEALEALSSGAVTAGLRDADRRAELRGLLDLALGRLPPQERMAVTLKELEGHSVREIAGMTGWSASWVKVRLFRARKKMRKILERMMKEGKVSVTARSFLSASTSGACPCPSLPAGRQAAGGCRQAGERAGVRGNISPDN